MRSSYGPINWTCRNWFRNCLCCWSLDAAGAVPCPFVDVVHFVVFFPLFSHVVRDGWRLWPILAHRGMYVTTMLFLELIHRSHDQNIPVYIFSFAIYSNALMLVLLIFLRHYNYTFGRFVCLSETSRIRQSIFSEVIKKLAHGAHAPRAKIVSLNLKLFFHAAVAVSLGQCLCVHPEATNEQTWKKEEEKMCPKMESALTIMLQSHTRAHTPMSGMTSGTQPSEN